MNDIVMTTVRRPLWLRSAAALLVLLVVALIYLPGLAGGFVYDDFSFIVNNAALHVQTGVWSDWMAAMDSFPAAHQGRWLGMLSFALNHYVDGLDPWGYKLVNLVIHLLNGLLLWQVLRALVDLAARVRPSDGGDARSRELAALAIAAIWLILPINLTPVLYISQRLESLSLSFVLLGLWGYLLLRARDWRGEHVGLRLSAVVLLSTGLGALVKESAALLPLYVACIELAVTGWKRGDGSPSKAARTTLAVCLALPLLAGLVWLASWVGGEQSYARSFGLGERLLTQGRVLLLYMQWTLLPNLNDLTLYHDDIVVSRGLFQPWTTVPALLVLAGLLGVAIANRRRLPLFASGILLFFAGHALTSTLIPLMLAFEHRNYFASIGLLLALASLLGLETRWLRMPFRLLAIGLLCLFYAGTTHLRVLEWSSPLRLAASEAAKRPQSVDAQYGFARALMHAANHDPASPLIDQAMHLLETHRALPGAGLLYDHALLILHALRQEPIDPGLWESMVTTMQSQPPRASDLGAVVALYECMKAAQCPRQYGELRRVIEAALTHTDADAYLFLVHGRLVLHEFGEPLVALRSFDEALRRRPKSPDMQFERALLLIDLQRLPEARAALATLAQQDHLGSLKRYLTPLKEKLQRAEGSGQ